MHTASRGVGLVAGRETSASHVMRINPNAVGVHERKDFARRNPGYTLNLGDGSGRCGIAALVPRVALPSERAQALGFDSLSFCLRGPAETQQVFGLAGSYLRRSPVVP